MEKDRQETVRQRKKGERGVESRDKTASRKNSISKYIRRSISPAETKLKSRTTNAVVYSTEHVTQLLFPVFCCLVLVVLWLNLLYTDQRTPDSAYLSYTPFHSRLGGLQTGTKLGDGLMNAVVFLAVIVSLSLLLLLLYWFHFYKVLGAWISAGTGLMTCFFYGNFLSDCLRVANIPCDVVTLVLCVWNVGAVGVVAVFGSAPLPLQQTFYVLNCSIVASFFIRAMPEWTVWFVLIIVAIWDAFAVLSPWGPLRILGEKVQQRGHQIGNGLIYTAAPVQVQVTKNKTIVEDEGMGLGLGDFIFYAILVGSAASGQGENALTDWLSTIICTLGILVGLCATLICLSGYDGALPALPVSIILALFLYFISVFFIVPFSEQLADRQIFI